MSDGLIGVIIGALAAILGGILGELIKYRLEIKNKRMQKMQEAYEVVQKCLLVGCSGYKHNYISLEDQMNLLDEMFIKSELYSKKKVHDLFGELSDYLYKQEFDTEVFEKKRADLIALMRRDLGIDRKRIFKFDFHSKVPT